MKKVGQSTPRNNQSSDIDLILILEDPSTEKRSYELQQTPPPPNLALMFQYRSFWCIAIPSSLVQASFVT